MSEEQRKMKEEILTRAKPGHVILLVEDQLMVTETGFLNLDTGKMIPDSSINADDIRGWAVGINWYFESKLQDDANFKKAILIEFANDIEDTLISDEAGRFEDFESLPDLLRQAAKEFIG